MDKATFLVQLQKNIGMLDDDEQKDIIDEYSQHIDMKVSGGMTEAEAIEDFGDFNEFVREVLNAYHVKAAVRSRGCRRGCGDRLADRGRPPRRCGSRRGSGGGSCCRRDEARRSEDGERGHGRGRQVLGPCEGGRFAGERGSRGGASGGGRIRRGGRSRRFGVPGCGRSGTSRGMIAEVGGMARSFGGVCWNVAKTAARWCWNFAVACLMASGGFWPWSACSASDCSWCFSSRDIPSLALPSPRRAAAWRLRRSRFS